MLWTHVLRILRVKFSVYVLTILTISHGDAARILEVYIAVLNKEFTPQLTF